LTTFAASAGTGESMYALVRDLFPICRSITGDGFRDTLQQLSAFVPISVTEVPTGTPVFDWTVPKEWNIRDAWIADSNGRRIVDFRASNLHVVNYSVPVRKYLSLAELKPHLHSLPARPDAIPYRTSYYAEGWGFCLRHSLLETLQEDQYEVCIDSTLEPGHLTYGECVLPGDSPDEILISAHSCHPSLANDNLSGMSVAVFLARHLAALRRRHTFRFLFIPGTIGSITWLSQHEAEVRRIRHGLVLSCLGDRGPFNYKRSRRGNAVVDRAAGNVLASSPQNSAFDFTPYGYDERQYCSPGFDLPIGCLTRTPNGKYPEYHTSDDDLSLVTPESLEGSLNEVLAIVEILEHNQTYLSLNQRCEPQLGRRGLYGNTGGTTPPDFEMALLWVLNMSDGRHSVLDISERSRLPFASVRRAAESLMDASLLRVVEPPHRLRGDTFSAPVSFPRPPLAPRGGNR
jgi:aminopeptidase-like protein